MKKTIYALCAALLLGGLAWGQAAKLPRIIPRAVAGLNGFTNFETVAPGAYATLAVAGMEIISQVGEFEIGRHGVYGFGKSLISTDGLWLVFDEPTTSVQMYIAGTNLTIKCSYLGTNPWEPGTTMPLGDAQSIDLSAGEPVLEYCFIGGEIVIDHLGVH